MITNEQILKTSEYLSNLIVTQWVNQHFLSPTWFILVFIILFSYALFFYLVDKQRIMEILLFGSLVATAVVVYDAILLQFGYWTTLISVLPFYPNIFLGNVTLIPLYAMLVYQYTSSWRSFILWNAVWAVLFIFGYYNFVLQNLQVFTYLKPFAVYIDFFLLSIVGLISRGIMVTLFKIEAKNGNETSKHSISNLITQPAMKPYHHQENNKDDDRK